MRVCPLRCVCGCVRSRTVVSFFCVFFSRKILFFNFFYIQWADLFNVFYSYIWLYALVPNNKSSWRRECLFFPLSPSLGIWEFKNYTTHYYSIRARLWAFKKMNTATEFTTAEITTFTKKNIYLLKNGPTNLVPGNQFDGKIKYFPIDQNSIKNHSKQEINLLHVC